MPADRQPRRRPDPGDERILPPSEPPDEPPPFLPSPTGGRPMPAPADDGAVDGRPPSVVEDDVRIFEDGG